MVTDFGFITTFSDEYYYGIKMCETMEEFLPKNADLTIYYEGKSVPENTAKNTFLPYPMKSINDFKKNYFSIQNEIIKGKSINSRDYDSAQLYRWDAIRFSWKIFSLLEFYNKCKSRYMVWIDADVHLTSKIPENFLWTLVEDGKYASYLNRARLHTECGFVIYDTQHPHHLLFWQRMNGLYNNGDLFKLKYWTDCHAFDFLIELSEKDGFKNNPLVDTSKGDHAWNGSPLHKYSRHFKGMSNKKALDNNKTAPF